MLVVPLLFERGGTASLADRVLVVDCPEAEQMRRVGLRSGLQESQVRAIMATQLPRAKRLARADDVFADIGRGHAVFLATVAAAASAGEDLAPAWER